MNSAEQRRLLVLNQLEAGVVSAAQAGQLLGLAECQVRRLRARYRGDGASVLAPGNRGRRPVNAVAREVAERVVELAQTTYQGFNQQHLTEMLAEREGLPLSRPTVHRILRAAGISAPRKRRPARAPHRRERWGKYDGGKVCTPPISWTGADSARRGRWPA